MFASLLIMIQIDECIKKTKSGNQSGGKIKYVLSKHIQTNIFDPMNDLRQVKRYKNYHTH